MKKILIPAAMFLLTTACIGVNDKALEPKVADLEKRVGKLEEQNVDRAQLRQKFVDRMQKDRETYGKDFSDIETLYQAASKQTDPDQRIEALKALIQKYPKANRSGCAVLYIGQAAQGQEKEEYLRKAINEYGDCWYGDGVQVGAYARFYLGYDYLKQNKTAEAEKLFSELRKDYPDAINHKGRPLKIPDLSKSGK